MKQQQGGRFCLRSDGAGGGDGGLRAREVVGGASIHQIP